VSLTISNSLGILGAEPAMSRIHSALRKAEVREGGSFILNPPPPAKPVLVPVKERVEAKAKADSAPAPSDSGSGLSRIFWRLVSALNR